MGRTRRRWKQIKKGCDMESRELENQEAVVDNDALENSQDDILPENSNLDEGGRFICYPQREFATHQLSHAIVGL
jgi:hypothetical protein